MAVGSLYLIAALLCALVAIGLRMPPLVGFLAAGFLLASLGTPVLPELAIVADLGVALLVFGIGLKLDIRSLLKPEVWFTSAAHMGLFTLVGAAVIKGLLFLGVTALGDLSWGTLLLVGFALSFSSTVVVVKVLDERGQTQALYGRLAVGVLVMQDVAAVAFITVAEPGWPSPWSLALVTLIPFALVLRWVWSRIGHGEVQTLFGLTCALVPGYYLFEIVGLRGDLGALIMGMLLAGHAKSADLSQTLTSAKDILLVGFFLSIGLDGVPTPTHLVLGLLLLALLPLQGVAYSLLFRIFGLRRRTTSRAGLVLSNFSEFGLIVAAMAHDMGLLEEQWVTVIAVAVAASFVVSAVLNRSDTLAERYAKLLPKDPPPHKQHPECRPLEIGLPDAVVLGMGRVGKGAAEQLRSEHGLRVVGVEQSRERAEHLRSLGLDVVEADAGDTNLWDALAITPSIRIIIVSLPTHVGNLEALHSVRKIKHNAVVASVSRYPDHASHLREAGADVVLEVYAGAGQQLADDASDHLSQLG